MSFHNRINERGAFRQHLNRAQNLVPRVPQKDKEDEEDEKQPTIAAATVAKTIAKITPATTIAKVTATPSVVRSTPVSVATTAATTARQFPIPKGDDPFGVVTTSTSSSAVPPPSSSPASIPPSASTASASSASAASQTAARGLVSSSVPVASPTPNVGLGDAAASALPASASSTPSADNGSSKGGLSGGAAGAIVAILILAVVGVGAFFARKYYKRRREIKRNTWGAGLVPALENKRSTLYGGDNAGFGSEPMPPMASIPPSPAAIKVPSAMYNSPSSASPPPFVPPTIQAPNGMAAPAAPQPIGEIAVVVRTFVPNLPDELHITTGEHIRVLNAFDDGWALCANIRNEQGVVPLECLQRDGKRGQLEMQLQPESAYGYDSNRASKRLSSLVPNATGTY